MEQRNENSYRWNNWHGSGEIKVDSGSPGFYKKYFYNIVASPNERIVIGVWKMNLKEGFVGGLEWLGCGVVPTDWRWVQIDKGLEC